MVDDVIGLARDKRALNQVSLVESNNSLYTVNDDQIAHYWNAGGNFHPVLNSTVADEKSYLRGSRPLILFNGGIWFKPDVGRTQGQKNFINRYFNQIYAQFNLNDLGFNFAPDIFESRELDKPAIKKKIEARTEAGGYSGLIIFDLFHDESSESDLMNYQVSGNQTLLQFVKDLLPLSENHLVVGLFSKKYNSTTISLLRSHVLNFWRNEPRVSFLFPTAKYSEKTLFSFEFGTVADFLRRMAINFEDCCHALIESQEEISSRYQNKFQMMDAKQVAVCSSTFLFFSQKILSLTHMETDAPNPSSGLKVNVIPKLPALAKLAEEHHRGFKKVECVKVESIAKKVFSNSVNFLNELSLHPDFPHRDLLFAIALSIYDNLVSGEKLVTPIPDEKVIQLYDTFSNGEEKIPFPERLFLYWRSPSKPLATSKSFAVFRDSTDWRAGLACPIKTTRTLHYARIITGNAEYDYETAKFTFQNTLRGLEVATTKQGLRDALGIQGLDHTHYGLFLLDVSFSRIFCNLVHKFHVVHKDDLSRLRTEQLASPMTDLWIGNDDEYFMPAEVVNKGLEGVDHWCQTLSYPEPFGDLRGMANLDEAHSPNPAWLIELDEFNKEVDR